MTSSNQAFHLGPECVSSGEGRQAPGRTLRARTLRPATPSAGPATPILRSATATTGLTPGPRVPAEATPVLGTPFPWSPTPTPGPRVPAEVIPRPATAEATPGPAVAEATPGLAETEATLRPAGGSRVRLSEEDKVKLVRLCILHQGDHRYGKKKVFWNKIRELLENEIGKELRDPQQTMNSLVTQFEAQIKKEEKESGTVQQDTELKQSLFEWVAHLEDEREQARDTQKVKAEVEKEQKKAKKARDNLLRTWSQRESTSAINLVCVICFLST